MGIIIVTSEVREVNSHMLKREDNVIVVQIIQYTS